MISEQNRARHLAIIGRYFVGDAASGEDRFAYESRHRLEARWEMLREEHRMIELAEAGLLSFWPKADQNFWRSEFEGYKTLEAGQLETIEQATADWQKAYSKLTADEKLSKATIRKYRRRMRAARNLVARERYWGMTFLGGEAADKFFAATRGVTVP